MDIEEANLTLSRIALKTNLSEGPEGIEKILRNINNIKGIPIHDLSKAVSIPVPVIAAIRKEMEKDGLLTRDSGMILTHLGESLLKSIGVSGKKKLFLDHGYIFPNFLKDIKLDLEQIYKNRPEPNFSLDQSHVDSVTAIMRAAYLYHHDAVEGRKILLLGDDDLTSIAIILLSQELKMYPKEIHVIDIDSRILDFIETVVGKTEIDCKLTNADLREPMDEDLRSQFDVFFTDPPYSINGFKLFVSKGVESLKNESGKYGFINFPFRPPDETVEIFNLMNHMGLALQEIINGFNSYVGAQIYSGKSNMIRCVTTFNSKPLHIDKSLPIYTASRK